MKKILAAARGDVPCDLVIRNGRIANVLSMEYEEADIAVSDGIIVGIGNGYDGVEIVDASGAVLIPGMIDGHLHIESTMLAPATFASVVLPLGTTTIMADPHEIANTCGLPGIEFMWRESLRTPLDVFLGAPSCVPASSFETPLQEIGPLQMMDCYHRNWCSHLGEMMNFHGVVEGDLELWGKITAARDMVKTAHLPSVTGRELCTYLISCCDSDHESNYIDEAKEKLRRGVWLMLREGATERNLEDLIPLILEDETRFARCMAVSDDLSASHILYNGHMDHKVRLMIEAGLRPLLALSLVTINPAQYFRLWDRGAIAPGKIADIVMVDSLEECRAQKVWKRGKLAADAGKPLFLTYAPMTVELPQMKSFSMVIKENAFTVKAEPGRDIRVMQLSPGKVLTHEIIVSPKEKGGLLVSDCERDIIKIAVVEKNKGTGRTAVGFVNGFGLKHGAIASSVAHDAHNFIAIAADDRSLVTAMNYLVQNGGGLVAVDGDNIIASLSLPIGGLMSMMEPNELAKALLRMGAAASDLGISVPHPYMELSFLSLSVIPELKLTDMGYVNMKQGGVVGLYV